MRRITIQEIVHQKVHAKWCLRRRAVWKAWKRKKRGGRSRKKVVIFQHGQVRRAWAYATDPMPEVFCLDENAEVTLEFLQGMRRTLWQDAARTRRQPASRRRTVPSVERYFDFTSIKKITPTAALVLASIYDRGKHILGYKPYTVDEHEWAPEVISVLRSVGFHELLEMQPYMAGEDGPQEVMVMKFLSGERATPVEVGWLQEQLADLLQVDEREALLYAEPYGGMLEAALNAHMWAYPPELQSSFPLLKRWWMTGAINTKDRTVTVAVYDQGVSIPGSLPKWKHYQLVVKMLRKLPGFDPAAEDMDAVNIRFAMGISKTKTELPQHGKGLHTMLEVAERARIGRLRILSRKGEYIWETGRKVVTRNYAHSIGGTLIEWRIQV